MIGRIHGTLLEKTPPFILLDVNGIGYEVFASMSTFYQIPEVGEKVTLHTHFVVREDRQTLYGFSTLAERTVFKSLIKISGVGPKLAITILSSIEPHQFLLCVEQQDITTLVKLPGVGKKTAERLVVEMRDRIADLNLSPSTTPGEFNQTQIKVPANTVMQDAVSALVSLGYKPNEAQRVVKAVMGEDTHSSEELIRAALKTLAA